MSTTILGELCHRQLFRIFPKFFKTATFQNPGPMLQISLEIFDLPDFLPEFLSKSNKFSISFGYVFLAFFDQKLSTDLEITKF